MTQEQTWLSKKYIVYRAVTNFWLINAIWLYFYRIFITDQQVGALDGVAFIIGIIAEVPSGALADKFGRDKLVRLGQVLTGTGLFLQAIGSDFTQFLIGQTIMMIGISLVSGADEALFFERTNFDKSSADWRKLMTRGSQAALISALCATIIGGTLHTFDPRLPWILNSLMFIVATMIIWPIKDTRPLQERQKFLPELRGYVQHIVKGFGQFASRPLWPYALFITAVQGLFYAASFGILQLVLLDRFHFDPFWGSMVISSSSLITVGILAYMHKNAEHLSERRILTLIALSAAAGLLLSLADIGLWGYVVILVLYAGDHILQPFMSEVLNNRVKDDQRATALSVASFFRTLPYALLAPLIGALSTHHQLTYLLILWPIFMVIAVVIYLMTHRRDAVVDLRT